MCAEANNKEITINRLNGYNNFVLVIVGILRKQLNKLIEDYKKAGIKMSYDEKDRYTRLLKSLDNVYNLILNSDINDVRYYNRCVDVLGFMLQELDSRTDDSEYKIWKFHNLLKSFPVTNPDIAPNIDDETNAFAEFMENGDEAERRYSLKQGKQLDL